MTTEELINLVKPENPYTSGYTPKANPYITAGNVTYVGLTQNKYTIIDTEDLYLFGKYRWFLSNSNGMYARTNLPGTNKQIRMHNLLFQEGTLVDHINRNSLDNRRTNLRKATSEINNLNVKPRSSSGYLGVYVRNNRKQVKYEAKIYHRGKRIQFGVFEDPKEAAKVVNEFREKLIKQLEKEIE